MLLFNRRKIVRQVQIDADAALVINAQQEGVWLYLNLVQSDVTSSPEVVCCKYLQCQWLMQTFVNMIYSST